MLLASLNQSQARSRRLGPWVQAGLRQLRSQTQKSKRLSSGRGQTPPPLHRPSPTIPSYQIVLPVKFL